MRYLLTSARFVGLCVVAAAAFVGCAGGDEGSSLGQGGAGGVGAFGGSSGGGSGGTSSGGTAGTAGSAGSGTGGGIAGTGGGFPGECTENEVRSCYSGPPGTDGVGECKAGTQTCVNGYWGPCDDEVVPTTEICNKRDDDCNGLEDEGLGQTTCGKGACEVTVENCVAGVEQTCTPKTGSATEKCDGVDDNCDGQVDEGCSCTDGKTQSCYTGDPTTKDVGECKSGTQTCSGGKWGTCNNQILPAAEKCDALDNDCDGQTDEGNPQSGQSCSTGKQGVCAAGTTSCQSNTLICVQTTTSSAEVCDGLDNNCNGVVDDGDPEGGKVCNTGKPGVCAAGTTKCVAGKVACQQNAQASTETCDGIDNDCDGQTDEGCQCINGQTQGCYTGSPSTQGVGPCKGGTQTCAGGQWGSCIGQVLPKTESCNNVDDDCDGSTDEGNPGGGASCSTGIPGICASGTLTCQSGSLNCVQNQSASPTEICGNGLDDNCNSLTDEGCSGSCAHDKCVTGTNLASGCEPCVTQICAVDPYCCSTSWDSLCVSRVRTTCNSLKCDEAKGTCPHTLCTTGVSSQPFTNGCDSAKANCVSAICAVDSFCCTTDWDSICAGEVSSVCNKNCN